MWYILLAMTFSPPPSHSVNRGVFITFAWVTFVTRRLGIGTKNIKPVLF